MERKRLLRGTENFKTLIEGNGYFVDKSLFIKEVIDDGHEVILLPRPRRFGKSFNLSMLAHFFDIAQPDNQKLFEPYKIWQTGAYYTNQRGKHPVIHLTLKEIQHGTFEECLEDFRLLLSDLYDAHAFLLKSSHLTLREKKDIQTIIDRTPSNILTKRGLKKLSQFLFKHYHEKVVILIDEYDAPIHAGYRNGYYKDIVKFMKAFLGGTLKGNSAIYKGVVTGILRVSKESIFSDLNNIEVYTVLNHRYADKFGFTETETQALLDYFKLSDKFELLKNWYDGYNIGNVADIYNPWSVTGYIRSYEEGFAAYWVNTSSDELIKERIIEKSATSIRLDLETLLLGKTIQKPIEAKMIFSDFDTRKELLWTLLVFSGYLTLGGVKEDEKYPIKIPNYEIRTLFRKIIWHWFEVSFNITHSLLSEMVKALTQNRIKDFEKYFKRVMGDTMSYFDPAKNPEAVWQAYFLGLLSIAKEDYIIRSNRESGYGRYDILMLPKDKTKYGVIIEIKAVDKETTENQIQVKLKEALNQIERNEYYKELVAHQIPKRVEIAVVFAGKNVMMLAK